MTILFAGQPMGSETIRKTSLLERLRATDLETLRALLSVIPNPPDSPCVFDVLVGVQRSLAEFAKCLVNPNDAFKSLVTGVDSLIVAIQNILCDSCPDGEALDRPMQRRIKAYPAWSLFIMLGTIDTDRESLKCAGAESAIKLHREGQFAEMFADNIRLALTTQNRTAADAKRQLSIFRRFDKLWREAISIFETTPVPPLEQAFEPKARQYILRSMTYASPRHRQGVFNRNNLSELQILQSAHHLKVAVIDEDDSAMQIVSAFVAGVPQDLALLLPLAEHACEDWFMVVDLKLGVIKTNIALIFPNSASPTPGADAAHRPANKIIVKPIPLFLALILLERLENMPDARVLGDLIPSAYATGRTLTNSSAPAVMPASVRRFLNSGAAFAIQIAGIDRLAAAAILNDFSIIPGARLYYCQIARMELWDASQAMFAALRWGEPTEFVDGLPVGSCVVPTQQAISDLFVWLSSSVASCAAGKRYSYASLICCHNEFVRYCGTLAALCLGARSAAEFDLTATSLSDQRAYVRMLDKKSGQFPGYLPVPVNEILAEQIRRLHTHYLALLDRLIKLDAHSHRKLIAYVRDIIGRKLVPIFVVISQDRSIPIGSSDLIDWWPASLKFHGNFGRDFWETELRLKKISAPNIDMFVRHQLLGVESQTSTSRIANNQWWNEISAAQEVILRELDVRPVYGLGKRGGKEVHRYE